MSEQDYDRAIEAIGQMMRFAQDEDDERAVREEIANLHARTLLAGFGARERAMARGKPCART